MAAGITYTPITSNTVSGSSTSTVTFSSIASTYTDLVLVMSYRSDRATTYSYPNIRFNSDTGSNYSNTYLYGDGTNITTARNTSQTALAIYEGIGNNATSSIFGLITVNIGNYSNNTTYKSILVRGGSPVTGNIVSTQFGLWRSTSAISTIDIYDGNSGTKLYAGSTFTLYGITAA